MMQVVCQLQSTRTLDKTQNFCFGPLRLVPIFLKFKQGPGATDFQGQARFRLQFRLDQWLTQVCNCNQINQRQGYQ